MAAAFVARLSYAADPFPVSVEVQTTQQPAAQRQKKIAASDEVAKKLFPAGCTRYDTGVTIRYECSAWSPGLADESRQRAFSDLARIWNEPSVKISNPTSADRALYEKLQNVSERLPIAAAASQGQYYDGTMESDDMVSAGAQTQDRRLPNTPFAEHILAAVEKARLRHGVEVEPAVIRSLIEVKSKFDSNYSKGGGIGLMEITKVAAAEQGVDGDLRDPSANILAGTLLFASHLKAFALDPMAYDKALAAYHVGRGKVTREPDVLSREDVSALRQAVWDARGRYLTSLPKPLPVPAEEQAKAQQAVGVPGVREIPAFGDTCKLFTANICKAHFEALGSPISLETFYLVKAIIEKEGGWESRSHRFEQHLYTQYYAKLAQGLPNKVPTSEMAIMAREGLEARIRLQARGEATSYGLMHILGRTARDLGFKGSFEELYDVDKNLFWGLKYLGKKICDAQGKCTDERFKKFSVCEMAAAGYNAGSARLKKNGELVCHDNYAAYVQNLYVDFAQHCRYSDAAQACSAR